MHLKLNDQTMQVEPVDLKPKPPKRAILELDKHYNEN